MRRLSWWLLVLIFAGCRYDNLINVDLRRCSCDRETSAAPANRATPTPRPKPPGSRPAELFDDTQTSEEILEELIHGLEKAD